MIVVITTLFNSEQKVQECDATAAASSNAVGNIKIASLNVYSFNNGSAS